MQKSAAVPAPASPSLTLKALTPYVLWALLAAGLTELFLFRVLSRVGVHIPKQGLVLEAYQALTSLGSYAFDVASVLVFLAIGLLAYSALHSWASLRSWSVLASLMLAFAAVSLLLAFVQETASISFVYGLASLSIMLLLAMAAWRHHRGDRLRQLIVTLIAFAYLGGQYHTLANQAFRALSINEAPPATTIALEVAEALVVANAFLIFWAWSGVRGGRRWRPSRLQLATASLLILVFVGSYSGGGSATTAILSLWTLGLTLYLPLPFYALALALYGATFVACLSDRTKANEALALGLLPVAGLTLELTYQHLLVMVVLLLLGRVLVVTLQSGGDPTPGGVALGAASSQALS